MGHWGGGIDGKYIVCIGPRKIKPLLYGTPGWALWKKYNHFAPRQTEHKKEKVILRDAMRGRGVLRRR